VLIADSSVLADKGLMEFYMTRYWNSRSVNEPERVDLVSPFQNIFIVKDGQYVVFSGKLLCLIDVSEPKFGPYADFYLIHGTNAKRKFVPMLNEGNALFLLDASLNPRVTEQFRHYALDKDYKVYDLRDQGAYVFGLSK
jgi:hypothetical protein